MLMQILGFTKHVLVHHIWLVMFQGLETTEIEEKRGERKERPVFVHDAQNRQEKGESRGKDKGGSQITRPTGPTFFCRYIPHVIHYVLFPPNRKEGRAGRVFVSKTAYLVYCLFCFKQKENRNVQQEKEKETH